MSMAEYTPRRLVSAKIKADQLKATGAKIVATSCHNCVDGLADLIKHYKLGMEVKQLVDLVAEALVLEKPAEVAEEKPAVAAEEPLAGRKILVVDDEADMRIFLSTVLEDNGATVIQAESGERALKLARSEKPDLMTLDLSMPGRDGGQVYETIRKDKELADLPVCIVTGHPELRKLLYAKDVKRPEGYMDKPVSEEDVLTNVRKILEVGADED
jgi:CheY-like chemotaxis protein